MFIMLITFHLFTTTVYLFECGLLFTCSQCLKSNFQIVPLLNHPNDNIVAEVFAFLSVFLHDGHKKVQVSMYCY